MQVQSIITAPIFVAGTTPSGKTLTSRAIGNHSFIFVAGPAHFLQYIYVRRREFGERDEGVAARQAIVERLKPIFARSNVNTYLARSDPIFRETDIERPPLAAIGYRNILVIFMEGQVRWKGKNRWANHSPHEMSKLQEIFTFFPNAKVLLCGDIEIGPRLTGTGPAAVTGARTSLRCRGAKA